MYQALGISGSLRAASYNTALLESARQYLPSDWNLNVVVPHDFPIYAEEIQQQGWPAAVEDLALRIRSADLLLIATPEYNFSIPGGLKNAIDWISRMPDAPFKGKHVAILGASSGRLGTVRAQMHLRQCLQFLESKVLSRPEVFVGLAGEAFRDTRLVDKPAQDALQSFITAAVRMALPRTAGMEQI